MKLRAIPMTVAVLMVILVSCKAQDPPPVTGDITIIPLGMTDWKASFPAVTGAFTEYVFTILPDTSGASVQPASTPKGSNSTVVANLLGLIYGTEFTFEVKTKNGSKLSAPKSIKFRTHPMEVSTEQISVKNLTTETAFIKWKTPRLGNVDNYKIKVSPKVPLFPASPLKGTEVLICGMSSGTHYLLEITSTYSGLDSEKTARYYFTTLKTPPSNIPNATCPTAIPTINGTYTEDGASTYNNSIMAMGLLLVFIWIARG